MAAATLTLIIGTRRSERTTDDSGEAGWSFVPRGQHRLVVQATGYEAQTVGVDVREPGRRTFTRAIELVRQPPR